MSLQFPADEAARLAALRNYQILDTEPEEVFDDLIRLASIVCRAPIALLSLIDQDRMWVKANIGFPRQELARRDSFCAHAIAHAGLFEVADASSDSRFSANKFVTGPPAIRFYAGAPLKTVEGYAVGTICVMDEEPRTLTPAQRDALRALSRHAIRELDSRQRAIELATALLTNEKTLCELAASELRFREVLEHATDVICTHTIAGDFTSINRAGSEICGYSIEELLRMNIRDVIAPEMLERALTAMASKLLDEQAATRYELDIVHRNGARVPLEVSTRVIEHAGKPVEIVGVGRKRRT